MLPTVLFGALALLGGVSAQTPNCLTPDGACEDCGKCDAIYTHCMNACLKTHPTEPGLHSKCTHACFCETAKEGWCGLVCGFDLEPHCTKKEIEVDFEIPPPDELVTKTADNTAFVRPVPTTLVAVPREVGPEIPPPGYSFTKTKSSTGLIHAVPVTISDNPSVVPPAIHAPTTLVTVTRAPAVKRQDDEPSSAMDECYPCSAMVGLCVVNHCASSDKAAAVECACGEPAPQCPSHCFATTSCAELVEPYFTGMCAAIQASQFEARQEPEVPAVPETTECSGCYLKIGECVGQTCPAEDKDGAVKCVCDHPTPECPASCFDGFCAEQVKPLFDIMCPSAPPAEKAAVKAPKLQTRQSTHVDDAEINNLPQCKPQCWVKVGHCEDLCGIPAQGTCLNDCLCDAETFGIPCPHECYRSGRCG